MPHILNNMNNVTLEEISVLAHAAEEGSADAQCKLAYCYTQGQNVEKNTARALALFEQAAAQGNLTAHYNLHLSYANLDDGKDYSDKINFHLQQAVALGDLESCVILAHRYIYAKGVERDLSAAIPLLEKAATKDTPYAHLFLWDIYSSEDDGYYDIEKAFWHLRRSVVIGDSGATFTLGYCKWTGDRIEKDIPASIVLLEEAAAAGEARAYYFLYQIYQTNEHYDANKILDNLRQAALRGHIEAQSLYGQGISREADDAENQEKLDCLQQAVTAGDAHAKYVLGILYEQGNFLPQDDNLALTYLSQAATQNDLDALYSMAIHYKNGTLGLEKDAVRYEEIVHQMLSLGSNPAGLASQLAASKINVPQGTFAKKSDKRTEKE